ncbi:hypothetical protein ACUXAV_002107 [Cupriavidus metallidurans]|jgi:hypothetical protein|uniref:hypothetical protein n=1 Tax=Cupriavidus TaxID=106589 RepID=UPI0004935723|nr:hypothetical protein [Cupriavidus metallidurans]KWW35561.1 hypothetical protein AU374_03628 [Cupriavidus metallidurans]MDE4921700.1 hypothetical protein [Cupriavidus metallidurans]
MNEASKCRTIAVRFRATPSATARGWYDVVVKANGIAPVVLECEGLEGMLTAARDIGRTCAGSHVPGTVRWVFLADVERGAWADSIERTMSSAFDQAVCTKLGHA